VLFLITNLAINLYSSNKRLSYARISVNNAPITLMHLPLPHPDPYQDPHKQKDVQKCVVYDQKEAKRNKPDAGVEPATLRLDQSPLLEGET
jgi:hypothetical protein